MFDALGVGGGGSLIGGVAVLLAPIPFVFYKYGGPIRKRSKFAPTTEKNDGEGDADRRPRDEEERSGVMESSGESESSSGEDTSLNEGRVLNGDVKDEESSEKGENEKKVGRGET